MKLYKVSATVLVEDEEKGETRQLNLVAFGGTGKEARDARAMWVEQHKANKLKRKDVVIEKVDVSTKKPLFVPFINALVGFVPPAPPAPPQPVKPAKPARGAKAAAPAVKAKTEPAKPTKAKTEPAKPTKARGSK
jgi:D-alanyl-D-alanine carboxypeptidase